MTNYPASSSLSSPGSRGSRKRGCCISEQQQEGQSSLAPPPLHTQVLSLLRYDVFVAQLPLSHTHTRGERRLGSTHLAQG